MSFASLESGRRASHVAALARLGRVSLSLLSAWAIVVIPRVTSACAVCTSGREDESNTAFLISTIFLSLLPLAGLGTLVFVVWRRLRAFEESTKTNGPAHAAVVAGSPADSVS